MKRFVTIVLTLMAFGLLVAGAVQAKGPQAHDACANRLCTKERPKAFDCRSLEVSHGSRAARRNAEVRMVKCYIVRAVRHYHVDQGLAMYRANRESSYTEKVVNAYGYAGIFQMSRTLFAHTPYYGVVHRRWSAEKSRLHHLMATSEGKLRKRFRGRLDYLRSHPWDGRLMARWATLAYGWINAHGGSCNWNYNGYCA